MQIACIAQSKESALIREREAAIISIISSKEKMHHCKMQLLTCVDDKHNCSAIDSPNVAIDSLNDELKVPSTVKRGTSRIVCAVIREAEVCMGIHSGKDDSNIISDSCDSLKHVYMKIFN